MRPDSPTQSRAPSPVGRLLSLYLGRHSSLLFGCLYLSLIPIFALIYSLLPLHFYQSATQHEGGLREDKNFLLARLSSALRKPPRREPNEPFPQGFNVEDIINDGKGLKIVITGPFKNKKTNIGDFWTSLRLPADIYGDDESPAASVSICIDPKDGEFEPDLERVLPPPSYVHSLSLENCGYLRTDKRVAGRLLAYSDALEGLPGASTGGFERMFYFSAMTVTTVGYGDIVPVTGPARLLVSLEAILGVILVGLFLNSLAAKITRTGNP